MIDSISLEIIGRGRNRILETRDSTAHSELLAIRDACQKRNNERLIGTSLITTLEPCLMCTGAISLARVDKVFFMTESEKGYMMRSVLSHANTYLNHLIHCEQLPNYKERSSVLLKKFFGEKRRSAAKFDDAFS